MEMEWGPLLYELSKGKDMNLNRGDKECGDDRSGSNRDFKELEEKKKDFCVCKTLMQPCQGPPKLSGGEGCSERKTTDSDSCSRSHELENSSMVIIGINFTGIRA